MPVDDTLAKRRGRKVFGCFWHHDATANSHKGSVAWGNNWVTAGINVKLPFLKRTVCLLVLFAPLAPAPQGDPEGQERPRTALKAPAGKRDAVPARQAVPGTQDPQRRRRRLRLRRVRGPAGERHDHLPPALRRRSAISWPRPDRPKGSASAAGRRRKDHSYRSLHQIATDPATQWVNTTVHRYGKTEQVMAHAFQCLWYEAFGSQPVQVVLIQDTTKPSGYELALDLHRPRRRALRN